MDPKQNQTPAFKQKLTSHLPQITIITATLLVIGFIIYLIIKNPPSPAPSPPTPTPSPSPVSTTLPLPQAKSILQNQDQTLSITWQLSSPQLPNQVPLYQIQEPLITPSFAQSTAQNFGFTSQHLITNQDPYLIWNQDQRSLSVNTELNQLTYNNPSPNLPPANFPDTQTTIQQITQKLNNLLNNPPHLQAVNEPQIPQTTEYQSKNSQQLRFLTFTQAPDDFPLFTTTPYNTPFTVIFDSQLNLHYLEILGGYQTLRQLSTATPISYSTLQQNASSKAQRLPTSPNIKQENQLNSADQLNFTAQNLIFAYFFDPQNPQTLQPVFSLTGPLSTTNQSFPSARFIVPALPDSAYQ